MGCSWWMPACEVQVGRVRVEVRLLGLEEAWVMVDGGGRRVVCLWQECCCVGLWIVAGGIMVGKVCDSLEAAGVWMGEVCETAVSSVVGGG